MPPFNEVFFLLLSPVQDKGINPELSSKTHFENLAHLQNPVLALVISQTFQSYIELIWKIRFPHR